MSSYHIIGHFGSRLSYATVASNVARGLRERGLLAGVTNLDDKAIVEHEDLLSLTDRGTHVISFADTTGWLLDMLSSSYGASRVAVFSSPNTDCLSRDRAEVCSKVGMVLAPSQWCLDTVSRSLSRYELPSPTWACKVPLGVSRDYLGVFERRRRAEKLRLLHLATDFAWPGRKGTEELLAAWSLVQKTLAPIAELVVHVPMAVYEPVHYLVADLDLTGVQIQIAPDRGCTDAELGSLYELSDVVVLPARCEGFGMMMLAACVSGTPLVTTYVTGQVDFLSSLGGWLGVACSDRMEQLEHEAGLCPVAEPRLIASALLSACSPMVFDHLAREAEACARVAASEWCWDGVVGQWIETLETWRDQ